MAARTAKRIFSRFAPHHVIRERRLPMLQKSLASTIGPQITPASNFARADRCLVAEARDSKSTSTAPYQFERGGIRDHDRYLRVFSRRVPGRSTRTPAHVPDRDEVTENRRQGKEMEGTAKFFGIAFLTICGLAVFVIFGTLIGAIAGSIVGLFFADTILGIAGQLGVHNVTMWQLGAFLGFVGGFLKTKVTASVKSEAKA
jgi:hypothetical protein